MGVKNLSQRLKKAGIYRSVRLKNGGLAYVDADNSKKCGVILNNLDDVSENATKKPFVLPSGTSENENCSSPISPTSNKRLKRHHRPELRVGVDVSMWIAKACFGMSELLVDERFLTAYSRALMEQLTEEEQELQKLTLDEEYVLKCVQSVIENALSLQDKCGIPCNNILVVFDGATPPAKTSTCDYRRKRKEDATVIQNGEHEDPALRIRAAKMAGAPSHLQIQIKHKLFHELRCHAIPFLVAPYESDSQLMYLSKMGYIDLVISTDSDLVAMATPALLRQLDMDTQHGELVRRGDLGAGCDDKFDLLNFTDTMIALMCVAAGCDYCENLPGVGIVRAYKAVRAAFDNGTQQPYRLQRIFQALYEASSVTNNNGATMYTKEDKEKYERTFIEAICMYLHPVVFDPIREKCIFARHPVTNPDSDLISCSDYYSELCEDQSTERIQKIVGKIHSQDVAKKIASAWYDPKQNAPYDV